MTQKEYGTVIPGLTIHGEPAPYGVVNERAIRAAAGIMFLLGGATFAYVFLTKDYTPILYVVSVFWIDFFLKTIFAPKWSIFGALGQLITAKQRPEYVGAIQKRFAWGIGLLMASTMFLLSVVFGFRGIAPLAICLTCLFFMWLESTCGICVGCKIYNFLLDKGIIAKPKYKPACPGGACSLKR